MFGISTSVIVTAVSYFIFSAAVGSMAAPTAEQEKGFYGWLYRFLQRLAANADRVVAARFPAVSHIDESYSANGDSTKTTDIITKGA